MQSEVFSLERSIKRVYILAFVCLMLQLEDNTLIRPTHVLDFEASVRKYQ
jgi:hypothetical protein